MNYSWGVVYIKISMIFIVVSVFFNLSHLGPQSPSENFTQHWERHEAKKKLPFCFPYSLLWEMPRFLVSKALNT